MLRRTARPIAPGPDAPAPAAGHEKAREPVAALRLTPAARQPGHPSVPRRPSFPYRGARRHLRGAGRTPCSSRVARVSSPVAQQAGDGDAGPGPVADALRVRRTSLDLVVGAARRARRL